VAYRRFATGCESSQAGVGLTMALQGRRASR
jgi:hypothetical protein